MNSEQRITGEWNTSEDDKLSLRLIVPANAIAKAEPLWLIAELRNNSNTPITTLRPLGAFLGPQRQISLHGPAGPVVTNVPYGYAVGCGKYVTAPPGGCVRDSAELLLSEFPGSDQPGNYEIRYRYLVDAQNQRRAKQYLKLEGIWQGSIQSAAVTICKE